MTPLITIILLLSPLLPTALSQSQQPPISPPQQNQCTAGVLFLRSFTNKSQENSIIPTTPSHLKTTYTLQVTYPCDTSPLPKIEKLKNRVKDPFVSFYLKKRRGIHRVKRLTELGSGDYDDDDDDDDDEDDGEEDEDEIEEDELDHVDFDNKSIEPSNHVMLLLPTPSVHESPQQSVYDGMYSGELLSRYANEITTNVLESIAPTRSFAPVHTYSSYRPTTEDENLLFMNVGSGDGPVVQTTPIYNPTEDSYFSSSSSPPTSYYASSYTPTPSLTAHLLHPIPKQMIYAGVLHTLVIPPHTFQPPCYEYALESSENWVDVKRNVVKFFPVTSHISDYNFKLECKDHGTVAEMFVSVRQRQKSRLHNHSFLLQFGMIKGDNSRVDVLEKLVNEVRGELGGSVGNGTDLVVLNTELDTYPFRVSYVNESVISNVCPVNEFKRIYERLQRVNGFVKMEHVKLVIPQDNNQCDGSVVGEVTGEEGGGRVSYGENFPPTIKNQIDRLNGSVGEYLVYGVRDDFCYDPEDGGTRNLNVELRSSELSEVGENYWLQFDGKNQEFYGLPMGVEEGGFVLVCSDKGGKSANDVIELQIGPPKTQPSRYNTEFNVHFQSIPFTPKAIRKFIEKLSQILSPQIQVHSYSESNNHVLFKWFNTSNPSTEHEVTEIRKVLLSDDGPVNKRFYEHFTPEFNVSVASVVPLRGLLSENAPVEFDGGGGGGGGEREKDSGGRYFDFDSHEEKGGGGSSVSGGVSGGGGMKDGVEGVTTVDNYSGYLTTYIIPSVLIAVMILLALIIACLLSRKNKYTQASTEDDSPNSRVYLKNAKKGVPVIFQDELDEKLFGAGGGQGGQSRGNIYEPPVPRSGTGTPQAHGPQRNDTGSTGMQSPRVISPQPPRGGYPAPPDYQNSISRSMMRNRHMGGMGSPPPAGGIPVFPPSHHPIYDRQPPTPHHPQHHHQIDSYAPPPGINYYGIHNSASGGSGFSGVSERGSGVGGPSSYGVASQERGGAQHHHHVSNKMAPPPYVPP